MKITHSNFFDATHAEFCYMANRPERAPDHKSMSGSEYWYTKDAVIRCSNHWYHVATCSWRLVGAPDSVRLNAKFTTRNVCGECKLADFEHIADSRQRLRSEFENSYSDIQQPNIALEEYVDVVSITNNDIINTGVVSYIIRDRIGHIVGYRVTNKHADNLYVFSRDDIQFQRCQYA